jgi:hypothetical protein
MPLPLHSWGIQMTRLIQGEDRSQATLLPELLDDYVMAQNPVRVIEVFVEELNLGKLGFDGIDPASTGRPAYYPATMDKTSTLESAPSAGAAPCHSCSSRKFPKRRRLNPSGPAGRWR